MYHDKSASALLTIEYIKVCIKVLFHSISLLLNKSIYILI